MTKTYLFGILEPGEPNVHYYEAEYEEGKALDVLKQDYLDDLGYEDEEEYREAEGEKLTNKMIKDYYFHGEIIVDLLYNVTDEEMLVENGDIVRAS